LPDSFRSFIVTWITENPTSGPNDSIDTVAVKTPFPTASARNNPPLVWPKRPAVFPTYIPPTENWAASNLAWKSADTLPLTSAKKTIVFVADAGTSWASLRVAEKTVSQPANVPTVVLLRESTKRIVPKFKRTKNT
jgi:hypothetical protein